MCSVLGLHSDLQSVLLVGYQQSLPSLENERQSLKGHQGMSLHARQLYSPLPSSALHYQLLYLAHAHCSTSTLCSNAVILFFPLHKPEQLSCLLATLHPLIAPQRGLTFSFLVGLAVTLDALIDIIEIPNSFQVFIMPMYKSEEQSAMSRLHH